MLSGGDIVSHYFRIVTPHIRPVCSNSGLVELRSEDRDGDSYKNAYNGDNHAESGNDDYKGYREIATQKDFDAF